jgi:hypothetical protein
MLDLCKEKEKFCGRGAKLPMLASQQHQNWYARSPVSLPHFVVLYEPLGRFWHSDIVMETALVSLCSKFCAIHKKTGFFNFLNTFLASTWKPSS